MADLLNQSSEDGSESNKFGSEDRRDLKTVVPPQSRTKSIVQLVAERLLDFVRTRGRRYIITGVISNAVSMISTNLLYSTLKTHAGVVTASLSCAVVHGLIIYCGHYFFTFASRQSFFKGFVKSLTANVPMTIIFSAVTVYVLKKEWVPFWGLQIILMGVGQTYGIMLNLFWVFGKAPSRKNQAHRIIK